MLDIERMKEYVKENLDQIHDPRYMFELFCICLHFNDLSYLRFRRELIKALDKQMRLFRE